MGNSSTSHIALADVDSDGDLDALVANWSDQPDEVWINDGRGVFRLGQILATSVGSHVTTGDIDGDADMDALVATFDFDQPVLIWENQPRDRIITVTTREDVVDVPLNAGLGDLPGPDGVVSLREAILVANQIEGGDTIEFDLPLSNDPVRLDDSIWAFAPLRIEGRFQKTAIDFGGNSLAVLHQNRGIKGDIELVGLHVSDLRELKTKSDLKVIETTIEGPIDFLPGSLGQ